MQNIFKHLQNMQIMPCQYAKHAQGTLLIMIQSLMVTFRYLRRQDPDLNSWSWTWCPSHPAVTGTMASHSNTVTILVTTMTQSKSSGGPPAAAYQKWCVECKMKGSRFKIELRLTQTQRCHYDHHHHHHHYDFKVYKVYSDTVTGPGTL